MKISQYSEEEKNHEARLHTLYSQYRDEYHKLLKNKQLSLQEITRIRDLLYESFLYFSYYSDMVRNKNIAELDKHVSAGNFQKSL